MPTDLPYFALGLLLLLLGADSALKGASGLAQRLGLSPFSAGVLLVGFATSFPELAVNARAVFVGSRELALGNAVGSNLVNIGLTLALAALAAPLLATLRLAGLQLVLLLVATGAVLFFGLDGSIARWEGGLLFAGFAACLALALRRGSDEGDAVRTELAEFAETRTGLDLNLVRLAVACGLLFFGARHVVAAAPGLGAALGFGPLLTGLTVVAIGTALPEAVTAVLAARRGQGNVVLGTVLGACLFNLLFVVGGMALLQPLPVPVSFVALELPVAMAFALLLYPMIGGDLRLQAREGRVLLALFALWLAYEVVLART